jgi:DNA-binding transcriptional LysR family regulator
MSDLDRFEYFACVAELNSLTRAAIKLKITKASLSKHIKKLEQDYKIDLFTRSGQRLHLTAQGQLLLEQCQRLQKELEETRAICTGFHDEPDGILNITIYEYFANKILFPKLQQFLKKYPKLKMVININERVPDLEKEDVDLAIGFSLPSPNEIVIQKSMGKTRYILCGSPEYFKEYGIPDKLQDLLHHKYIGHVSRPGSRLIKLKPEYKLNIKPYLIVNTVAAMVECAKSGLGLIQIPLYIAQPLLDDNQLIGVLEKYQAVDESIYYYYSKFRYVQPKVRKFIDYFLL